jgi:hypothetical protein
MNLFDRLARGRPAPEPEPNQPPSDAQKMLDWLLRWNKPTVSACEIYQYAPRSVRRDKESAIKNAEVLVRHGWLTALKTNRRHYRIWEITRKPVIHPVIEE